MLLLLLHGPRKQKKPPTAPRALCGPKRTMVAFNSQLDSTESAHLAAFAATLSDSHCRDDAALAELNASTASRGASTADKWWSQFNFQIGVACDTQQWWVPGEWVLRPMWKHCCNKGPGLARCPKGSLLQMEGNRAQRYDDSATLLCSRHMEHIRDAEGQCTVYSFGIASNFAFEDWMGTRMGCDVHAFDPTERFRVAHEAHTSPNVSFHYFGLGAVNGTAANLHINYGDLKGRILPLTALQKDLGHSMRQLSLLKVCTLPVS